MKRRMLVFGLLAVAAVWPASASAQRCCVVKHEPWYNRFSLEPYAGAYFDNAGRTGAGFDDSAFLGGLRLGYGLGYRARLIGDAGYARFGRSTDDLAPGVPQGSSDQWLLTGGLELDVVPGETGGSVSLQGGVASRALTDRYSESTVLVPGFSVHHQLTPRADLKLGIKDYIFLRDEPVSHNFAFTAGISLR